MRKRFEITVTFTYNDGTPGGVLNTTVNSRRAVDTQMAANRQWLATKGHTINDVTIKEV